MKSMDPKYSVSGKTEIDEAADRLDPHTYKYISPALEPRSHPNGGRYAGVIAQHLMTHPLTRQVVQPDENGTLSLEGGPLLSLLSSVAGRHHDRLGAIESKLDEHNKALTHLHGLLAAQRPHVGTPHIHATAHGESEKQRIAKVLSAKFGPR